jgi:outer membrane lipoprotein-sorting protein
MLTLLLSLLIPCSHAGGPSAEEIVRRSDEIRNPGESYFLQVRVTAPGSPASDEALFDVSIRGNDRTLIRTVEPARDRGRNLLMLGEDMWAYLPSLKRAVRVSLAQKLSGQAANGDISRMRWSGDYEPTLESETPKEWVVYLKARKKGLTYEKIRAWIEKGSFRPLRADYLTPADKPLKHAAFQAYRTLAGRSRPGEIAIQDATRPSDQSLLRIEKMEMRSFPLSLFQQNSLE